MINVNAALFDLKRVKTLFRRRPERLGLEICGNAVRIARVVTAGDGSLKLSSYGNLDIDIRNASVMEQQRFKAAIAQLGEGIVHVAVGMEHPTLRVRRMSFAKMPDADLLEAIKWNFREQVEGSIDKYVIGYSVLEGIADAGKMTIMAYGVSQDAVKEYIALTKSYGLKLVSLEPVSTALLATFYANGILNDNGFHVCIAFGDNISQFIVMNRSLMLFSRPLAGVSDEALVKLVMRNLNVEQGDAETMIATWIERPPEKLPQEPNEEISGDDLNAMRKIETTVGHFMSQMVIEIQRSIDAFCIMYGVDRVDDIYVCGGGAAYPGLVAHMGTNLGVESRVFNPFKKLMEVERQTDDVLKKAPLFATAIGLAIP